ncbi:ABC transporter ATP-binding protein [Jeotgalibacillus sp. S-D1]|uniref:ABC transporter ATP-binding protein n=1 Tax=Jeotgalibacillus sp. S-D1 TaxID=2552189 RepID=UPI0010598F19|nr:ABC transporter ATP-binding protein [Jeotgalibacillus sp. S-D1]TDL30479.1 ABC transporter ATP-binding protein [Jeotgalibacillus sp. S-D1]
MNKVYFEVKGASKSFKTKSIFQSVSFSLQQKEILSLVGPSGTGKSTLLRSIAGLEPLSSGDLYINGVSMSQKKMKDRPIGMVFQQPLLFPHLTILENVIYGLRLKKKKREAEIEGLRFLQSVGLIDYKDAYPHSLSGGQQQRVALIRALIVKPKLLLLDEPFSNLDPDLRRELRDWVLKLLKQEGMTAIFVTHDREEAMLLGDRVAVLAEGSLQQIGPPRLVYDEPANELVARFYSDALIVDQNHYILNQHLSWSAHPNPADDQLFFEAEWLNDTYQYGQRYAHVKLLKTNRRYVVPLQSDEHAMINGERGFICARKAAIHRFTGREETDE